MSRKPTKDIKATMAALAGCSDMVSFYQPPADLLLRVRAMMEGLTWSDPPTEEEKAAMRQVLERDKATAQFLTGQLSGQAVYDGKRQLTPRQLVRARETIRKANAAKQKGGAP